MLTRSGDVVARGEFLHHFDVGREAGARENAFEQIVAKNPTDEGVLNALKEKLGPAWPSDHAITDFNNKFGGRRPDTPEKVAAFEQRRAACAPTRKKVETYFDLIDLEEDRLS